MGRRQENLAPRDYYEAETSIGRLVQKVLRERELSLVQEFAEVLAVADRKLSEQPPENEADVAFKRQRLHELQALAKLGESLLSALVSGRSIDPAPLLRVADRR